MEHHKFSVGDRVEYVGQDSFAKLWGGSIGTLMSTRDTESNLIEWDRDSAYSKDTGKVYGRHPLYYIKLAEPLMMQYDPAQQGDTEEDI